MVGINDYIDKKHHFHNGTVQDISQGGVYCRTKVGVLCAYSVDMAHPVKNWAGNGMQKIFNFWGHNIDVYDQYVFVITDVDHNDEERKILQWAAH